MESVKKRFLLLVVLLLLLLFHYVLKNGASGLRDRISIIGLTLTAIETQKCSFILKLSINFVFLCAERKINRSTDPETIVSLYIFRMFMCAIRLVNALDRMLLNCHSHFYIFLFAPNIWNNSKIWNSIHEHVHTDWLLEKYSFCCYEETLTFPDSVPALKSQLFHRCCN